MSAVWYFARLLIVALLFVAVLTRVAIAAIRWCGLAQRREDAPGTVQTTVYAMLMFALLLTFLR